MASRTKSQQQLNDVAIKAINTLRVEVRIATSGLPDSSRDSKNATSNPRSFLTILKSQLDDVKRGIDSGAQIRANVQKVLATLERLSTWPDRFEPPSPNPNLSNLTSYPRLHMLAKNDTDGRRLARKSLVALAKSGSSGMRSRTAFCASLRRFVSVDVPPRGAEASLAHGHRKKPIVEDTAAECLRGLYTTLCQLAQCPNNVEASHFMANLSLNFTSGPSGSDERAIVELFIFHNHMESGRISCGWRETRIVAACKPVVKFHQVGERITHLCALVRDPDPSRVKLSAFNNGIFRDGVELPGQPQISLQAPSVSLAKLLASASMRDEQRRLLLSYLLAKAVWMLYDVDWIADDWTKDAVHFMQHHLSYINNLRQSASLSHKPFIQVDLGRLASRLGTSPETAAEHTKGRTHVLPKILALGIVLLEVDLGRPIMAFNGEDPLDMNNEQRANAAHIAACNVLLSPEWKAREKRAYRPVFEAIEICIKPDTSRLDPEKVRDSLYANVVSPLGQLFSDSWLPKGQLPEMFTPDPIEFIDTIATSDTSSDSEDELSHSTEHVEDEQVLEDDWALFGAEDGHAMPQNLRDESTRWIKDFKSIRQRYKIGREPQRIKVAILDTGVDASHVDFKGKPIIEYKSFIDGGDATVDQSGHGTHIAGIVLDLASNVDLYIAQITHSRLSLNRDRIVKALHWARTEWQVDMISLSFGYRQTSGPDIVQQEIEDCLKSNIVVFASASNDGAILPRTYPGNYNGVFCIHSTSGLGTPSTFNPTPEMKKDNFSVLGDGIKSSWPTGIDGQPTYRHMSGTSFAVPVAVSTAALVIGYIRMVLRDFKWNTNPLSPNGVKIIFDVLSKHNRKDGYDLVSPMRFFSTKSPSMIRETLIEKLRGYSPSKELTS